MLIWKKIIFPFKSSHQYHCMEFRYNIWNEIDGRPWFRERTDKTTSVLKIASNALSESGESPLQVRMRKHWGFVEFFSHLPIWFNDNTKKMIWQVSHNFHSRKIFENWSPFIHVSSSWRTTIYWTVDILYTRNHCYFSRLSQSNSVCWFGEKFW